MPKTLWELCKQTERVPLETVYAAILKEAREYRDSARQDRSNKEVVNVRELCNEVANALYQACAALENTEELNPTKK